MCLQNKVQHPNPSPTQPSCAAPVSQLWTFSSTFCLSGIDLFAVQLNTLLSFRFSIGCLSGHAPSDPLQRKCQILVTRTHIDFYSSLIWSHRPCLVQEWGESWSVWLTACCMTHFEVRLNKTLTFNVSQGDVLLLPWILGEKHSETRRFFYCRSLASSSDRVEQWGGRKKTAHWQSCSTRGLSNHIADTPWI